MEERGTREDKPMKPQVVAWELGKRLRWYRLYHRGAGRMRRHSDCLGMPFVPESPHQLQRRHDPETGLPLIDLEL
jgi:hypothetical protein